MIVYLARDISAFGMYCVYGISRSSLLIESIDSMIHYYAGTCNFSVANVAITALTMITIIGQSQLNVTSSVINSN